MTIYLIVGALIAGLLTGGGAAWKVQDWRFGAAEKTRIEAEAEKRRIDSRAIDAAAAGHERDKTNIQTKFVTITEEVERVVEKPVYRDVCLDADGLRVLRDAIGVADPAGEPAPAVPRPRATD